MTKRTELIEAALTKVSQLDSAITQIGIDPGSNIYEVLAEQGYCRFDEQTKRYVRISPFVVQLNGEWYLEKTFNWLYVIKPGDVIRIEKLAGGGKGGGSKGLGIIVAIIAIVAAPFTGGASLLLLGVSAAMLMAGMAGVPKQTPTALSGKDGASPTYSLTAQGNQARLLSAVPKLYGTMLFTPDLASQPYTEFEGNDQYLYELFALSCGDVDLIDILVDETPLSQFDNVQTQLVRPYQSVTLFPDNVVTSPAVDGIQLSNSVTAGPYVVGAPGSKAVRLGLDFTFPGGCYQVDANGNTVSVGLRLEVYLQQVNDAGVAIGEYKKAGQLDLAYATQTPQRVSAHVTLADIGMWEGRYQVSITRQGPDNTTNNKVQNTVVWTGLKAYLKPEPGSNYGNVTLLAVKMKSSEALNSSTARKFRVKATGKTPSWSPAGGFGDPYANNSIAWAAADILYNRDYGKGMPASRIDMPELSRLDAVWRNRGDSFNGLFDTTTSVWEALSKVLRAGRAAPVYYAGKVEFVRDEPQSLPAAMFQPRNIVAGSLSVQHRWPTSSTPDYIIIQYMDGVTWTQTEVDCILPNTVTTKPARVELFGVTNRDQAYREGMFLAAANRLRRRTIRFSTEMPGQVVRYNDLIQVSHDMADWGFSGVVLSFDRVTGRIRTSEPLPFLTSTCVIAFRKKNGSAHGPFNIVVDPTIADSEDTFGGIVLGTQTQREAVYISDGVRSDFTMYQFGPTSKAGLKALVTKVTPRGDDLYNIETINYVPSIYYAETGQVAPPDDGPSNLPKPAVGPIVDRITVVDTTTPGQQAVQITPAVGAKYYEYQWLTNDGSWGQLVDATQRTAILVNLPRGNQRVRARGYGTTLPGPWVTWSGEIRGTVLGLPELASLTTTRLLFKMGINWTFKGDTSIIADYTTVIVSSQPIPNEGNSKIIGEYPYPTSSTVFEVPDPNQTYYVFAAVTDKAGRQGPFFNNMGGIVGGSDQDPGRLLEVLQNSIGDGQLNQAMRDKLASLIADNETLMATTQVIQQTIIDDRQAVAQYVTQIQAQIDSNNTAINQIIQEVSANVNGELSAMTMVRTQVRVDGKLVTAGIGLGVHPDINDPTQYNSEMIFQAGAIAFTTSAINDPFVTPMVIKGNNVYMHGAFISDATVGYAQIMDAAIGSAKIQDLSVETIKVAGEAITIPRYTDNGGPVYGQGAGVGIKILELIFTTDSYSGALMTFGSSFQSNGEQRYSYWMVLDGVTLCRSDAFWSDSSIGLTAGRYLNAGSHTLQVYFAGEAGTSVYYANLVMQAAKR